MRVSERPTPCMGRKEETLMKTSESIPQERAVRTIIAGTRTITDYPVIEQAVVRSGIAITEVVCGGAKGVDSLGEHYAEEHGIPVKHFLPDWSKYGRAAGHRRNQAMAQYAEGLILVWDGKSRGSANMLKEARACKLDIYEVVTQ